MAVPYSETPQLPPAEQHQRPSIAMATNGVIQPDMQELSQLDSLRSSVESSLGRLKGLLGAMNTPLPTETGDGTYLPQPEGHSASSDIKVIIRDLQALGFDRVEDLAEVIKRSKLGHPLDDKQYYMERLIQSAAMLPDALVSKNITNTFITTLWQDLDHPPRSLLHDDFLFRQPDGSKNSHVNPQLGAAGMPYSRTTTTKMMRAGVMPDAGVLFDALMARKDTKGTPHPTKTSSMLFYLASIITHDAFKTSRENYSVSDTSSYLDLSPLYGCNWTEQKTMRTMKDGRIKPDCFAETRLLTFPPGVGALLFLFNRYHNYVVQRLADINEQGRFTEDPKNLTVERYGETLNKRDDDLFQTARLITCSLYVNIILVDYVRTILNLNRTDHNWKLDPRVNIPDGPSMGTGNQVSAEFNLVYRWHASVSVRDDQWTQELFHELFPGTSPSEVADPDRLPTFLRKLGEIERSNVGKGPNERPFPALEREQLQRIASEGPSKGRFKDDDLAAILSASVEDCANAMGPQQVPAVMKAIEMLGISQARSWKLATLNEFRKHFDLEPHRTFESITSNKEVAEALRHLYNTPDNVELYPGLQIEDAKDPMLPASGLCPSYTVSRSVLSDAVALVRGDRFYTTDYSPTTLTNWGFQEISSDNSIDNGCVFYKLLLRGLPDNYHPASVYAHYPFTVPQGPDGMKDVLQRLGKAQKYNFDKPARSTAPAMVVSYEGVKKVLDDRETYTLASSGVMDAFNGARKRVSFAEGKARSTLDIFQTAVRRGGIAGTIEDQNEKWLRSTRNFYEDATASLLQERAYQLAGTYEVDMVRDIGNILPVYFVSELFSLPLKTVKFPQGIFTEQQMYLVMASISSAISFDADPLSSFSLRQLAYEAVLQLGNFMQLQISAIQATGSIASALIQAIKPTHPHLADYGTSLIAKLIVQESDVPTLIWDHLLASLSTTVTSHSSLFATTLDHLFSPAGQDHLPRLTALASKSTPEADTQIAKYILEATRFGANTALPAVALKPTSLSEADRTYDLRPGAKLTLDLAAASHDPAAFTDPDAFSLARDEGQYIHLDASGRQGLGGDTARVALTAMLKAVLRLKGLRASRVSVGRCGRGARVERVPVGREGLGLQGYLTEEWDAVVPYPTSLKVSWDPETVRANGEAATIGAKG